MQYLAILALVVLAAAEPWDSRNDPSQVGQFNYNIKTLATSGQASTVPWSDTYWPSSESGIAHRWNSDNPQDFAYQTYTKEQLLNMTTDDLATLSPAEKFDIYNGRYDYPTVQSELSRTNPSDPGWEGLCHGWAPAALHFAQPDAVTLKNADGIDVPFGSSDVKALLTYWTGEYDEQSADTWFVGGRCNVDIQADPSQENSTACKDMNAGAFHVLLANTLSTSGNTGFVVDRDRSIQVWNQPVSSFTTSVTSTGGSSVTVATVMSYAKETYPQWRAHSPYILHENYQYTLDVDGEGNIVGGDHITWDRTDFMWQVTFNPFSGYFTNLQQIYDASTHHGMLHANAPRKTQPRARPANAYLNHNELTLPQDSFGLQRYPNNWRTSWSIVPSHAKSITIAFTHFNTERFRDKVKVYEGANGEGALVAVFHGEQVPRPVTVNAPAALVVFTSDRQNSGQGFNAFYRAN